MVNEIDDCSKVVPAELGASIYTLAADGPRKLDMEILNVEALQDCITASIAALEEIACSLPELLVGCGTEEIPLVLRHRLAEVIKGTSGAVQTARDATRTLQEMLPESLSSRGRELPQNLGTDGSTSLGDWGEQMRAPIECVCDLVNKRHLLEAVSDNPGAYRAGVERILADLEVLGASALVGLPVYVEQQRDEGDLFALHRQWLALRAEMPSEEDLFSDWAAEMAALVHRIMMFPAWTAAARRLKFEVLRTDVQMALTPEDSQLDPRLLLWLAALEVDATRRVI